jgi:hypothetical protein
MTPKAKSGKLLLTADHPQQGILWAAVDPMARFVEAGVRHSRFGARLAPFTDEASARCALKAAGARLTETAQ